MEAAVKEHRKRTGDAGGGEVHAQCENCLPNIEHAMGLGLTGIEMHPKRPALVLSFADQPHLYIPKYLSGRETFIAEMRAIAAQNAHAAPDHHRSLRYRMGL